MVARFEKGMLPLMSDLKKREKNKSFLREYFFSDKVSFDAKMNNSIGGSGIIAALLVALVHIIAGSDTTFILIIVVLAVVVAIIVYFANRFQMYKQAIVIDMILVCDIFIPLIFFFPGGINGSTTYFVLTILLIVLITEGKAMYWLLGSHVLVVAACLCVATARPDLMTSVTETQKNLNDIIAVVVTTLMLSVIIVYRQKLFMHEQDKVEAANLMLRKQELLLRCINEAATILLAADSTEFSDSFSSGIGLIAGGIGANKATLWVIMPSESGNRYESICEWGETKGVLPVEELSTGSNVLTTSMPRWDDKLSMGEYVMWTKNETGEGESNSSELTSIKTLLVVPIFIFDEYWGALSFIDMYSSHQYSDEEIDFAHSGSLIIANAYNRDSSMKALVEAREKAIEGTRAKTDFLSNMSHEIRTPMNAIIGMTQIAKNTSELSKTQECLDRISSASKLLLSLINDILDMSKIEANKLEIQHEEFAFDDIVKNIETIIDVKVKEKNQTLLVSVSDTVPQKLIGDELRLVQVVNNLLSNAIKFTPDKGTITVNFDVVDVSSDDLTLEARVQDSGIGISDEQKKRLFDSFEQAEGSVARKFGGTGLGLAISKNIVELMGGTIDVISELGEGSKFVFTVKMKHAQEHIDVRAREKEYSVFDFSSYQLLLAEDIEINREIVTAMLESTNIKIDCAENGIEACNLMKEFPEKYNIIFMDLQMPEMGGIEATQKIRSMDNENCRTIPIIAMTANAFKEDVDKCLEAGMNGHLAKPIDEMTVLRKISEYIS